MDKILVLGIGNLLMGDEGIGIHIAHYLEKNYDWKNVDILDGGTGGFHLLGYFQNYPVVILIDATIDGQTAGTVTLIKPKYSSDYPPTLTAHDIGLKDLLDALYLMNSQPEIWLYTVSIQKLDKVTMELSPEIEAIIPVAAQQVAENLSDHVSNSS
ncbi:MAG: hydrogenase maturation protease [bacterium]|nr:MAG: hydrogenase maturation protease [bacterium]